MFHEFCFLSRRSTITIVIVWLLKLAMIAKAVTRGRCQLGDRAVMTIVDRCTNRAWAILFEQLAAYTHKV